MTKISATRIDLENGRLDNGVLKYWRETLVGGASGTNAGSAYTVDLSLGNTFHLILNANCTISFSSLPNSGTNMQVTLLVKQDSSTTYATTWPANVFWMDGVTPPTGALNTYNLYQLFTVDGGIRWFGVLAATRL